MLAFIANLTKDEAEVRVQLDSGKLGLPAGCVAEDGVTGEKLPLQGNTLTLKLAAQDWRTVRIKAAP